MNARTVGLGFLCALGAFAPELRAAEPGAAEPPPSGAASSAPTSPSATPTATGEVEPVVTPIAGPASPPGPTVAKANKTAAADAAFASGSDSAAAASDSFSNDDAVETEQQHKLDLYGFADLTYTRLIVPQSSSWNRVYFPTNSFAVGNFNLYLSSNLGDSWRALGEVRFLYLPNGATTADAQGNVQRTDTTVLDYAGFEEPIHWGAIRIERVWVEHEFSSLFKLQVGAFLTPYGIWNVDHGTPAIIGIRAPFAVADELFPAHQTGLQLYGNTFYNPFEIGYHLTLSNGRGPVEYEDFSDDKAVGGRLYLKTDAFGSLTVGASAYRGGYYDRKARYVVVKTGNDTLVDQQYTTSSKYQEFSFGADLKWQYKRWLVQGEYIMNEVAYKNGEPGARPAVQVFKPPQGFASDYRRWGIYGLLGYRTHFIQTMPYVVLQYVYAPDNPIIPPILGTQIGLNIRPTPAVVLKLEYSDTHFYGPGSIGLGHSPLRILASQVAWAF